MESPAARTVPLPPKYLPKWQGEVIIHTVDTLSLVGSLLESLVFSAELLLGVNVG